MRKMTVRHQGSAAFSNASDSPQARPTLLTAAPNGFELTGAGLAPRCNDDRREAGVRCSEGLDDAFIC